MKTVTIDQQYNVNTKITHVTCEYRESLDSISTVKTAEEIEE